VTFYWQCGAAVSEQRYAAPPGHSFLAIVVRGATIAVWVIYDFPQYAAVSG
jgi:hypothetical protein